VGVSVKITIGIEGLEIEIELRNRLRSYIQELVDRVQIEEGIHSGLAIKLREEFIF